MFTDHSTLMLFEFKEITPRDFNNCEEVNQLLKDGWRVLKLKPSSNAIKVLLYRCPIGKNYEDDIGEHNKAERDWNTNNSKALLTT
ncbi:MAG: hypothetical protein QG585_604 [Patescibacteria group bacterium]|nr:hypothetical protein [Patescibacteria group bacterium]